MTTVLVIGGGIIGTMHAREALKQGHRVIHVERDGKPRSASVRNFGLVWIGGRASGEELNLSLRTRELWQELHQEFGNLEFRGNGSMTIARSPAEMLVLEQSMAKPDARSRQWQLLSPEEVRQVNPALQGQFLGGLYCPLDAAVEPSVVLTQLREALAANANYEWHANVDIVSVDEFAGSTRAAAKDGRIFEADLTIVCPGADHTGLFEKELRFSPLRRVRLQMMSTEPFPEKLTTSVADGDSLRYYPAYDVPALADLPAQNLIAAEHKMQLLLVQRTDGTLTIGDTHEYEEPFEFTLREDVYEYLHEVASDILGQRIPPITRRWDGVYSQRTDGAICERTFISKNIVIVTGPGGRGNTLAPAIAEATFKEIQ
jgi:FAD dependent oxidoreductase TIGR03364